MPLIPNETLNAQPDDSQHEIGPTTIPSINIVTMHFNLNMRQASTYLWGLKTLHNASDNTHLAKSPFSLRGIWSNSQTPHESVINHLCNPKHGQLTFPALQTHPHLVEF